MTVHCLAPCIFTTDIIIDQDLPGGVGVDCPPCTHLKKQTWSYTEHMKALADCHINFVLWLSGGWTSVHQPVAVQVSGQSTVVATKAGVSLIFGVSTTCIRSTVEFLLS